MTEKTQKKRLGLFARLKKLIQGNGRFSEIIRFGLVGGMATMIQYGIYVVFVNAVKVPAVPSTMISYAISFIFNFLMSNYFTFRTKPTTSRGFGFAMSHLINMGLQVGFVAIFKEIVGPTLALLPTFAICIPVNYLLVRFVLTSPKFYALMHPNVRGQLNITGLLHLIAIKRKKQ